MRFFLSLCLAAISALPAWAGDFDAVISAVKQAWPERQTVVVICNKDSSSMALMDLGSATENSLSLFVLHVTSSKELEISLRPISRKPRNELVALLIADDPVTGDGTEACRTLIARMAAKGIPVVGTTAPPLKQGALFSIGSGTGDKLLTNPEMAKKLGLTLPDPPAAAAAESPK